MLGFFSLFLTLVQSCFVEVLTKVLLHRCSTNAHTHTSGMAVILMPSLRLGKVHDNSALL